MKVIINHLNKGHFLEVHKIVFHLKISNNRLDEIKYMTSTMVDTKNSKRNTLWPLSLGCDFLVGALGGGYQDDIHEARHLASPVTHRFYSDPISISEVV